MRFRLWRAVIKLGAKMWHRCCGRSEQVSRSTVETSKSRLANCCEKMRSHRNLSECGETKIKILMIILAYSPIFAIHLALLSLTVLQNEAVLGPWSEDVDKDCPCRARKSPSNNSVSNAMGIDLELALAIFGIALFCIPISTVILVDNFIAGNKRPIADDADMIVFKYVVRGALWTGLVAASVLSYRIYNFESGLEGAVKASAVDVVRKCCESASINITATVGCNGMAAAISTTNSSLINSTAPMSCACNTTTLASEICTNYLKLLHCPYMLPQLLLSIVHVLLLAPIPALEFYEYFGSIVSYLYKRLFFPSKPIYHRLPDGDKSDAVGIYHRQADGETQTESIC